MDRDFTQGLIKDASELEQFQSGIVNSPERLKAFFELSQTLSSKKNVKEVIDAFLKTIESIATFSSYGIYIFDEADNRFYLKIDSKLSPSIKDCMQKMFEEGIIDWIIESKNPRIMPCSALKSNVDEESNLLVIPLVAVDKTIGVFIGQVKPETDTMRKDDIDFLSLVSSSVSASIEHSVLYESMNKKIKELNILCQASREMGSAMGIYNILVLVLELTNKVIESEYSIIFFLDKENNSLDIKASRGLDKDSLGKINLKIGEDVSGWVAQRGQPMLVSDYKNDIRFNKFKDCHPFEIRNVLSVPLLGKRDIFGVLTLYNRKGSGEFSNENFHILNAIAGQVGTSIEVANLYESLNESYKNFIIVLANAIEARDQYTRGHIERVTKLAKAIAEEMGWKEDKLREIEIGGILHDIGKIGVSDNILNKTQPLTSEEYEVIKTHPIIGSNMLKTMSSFDPVIPYILYHHEKYDGTGYPFQLKGANIPLEGRVMAVADAFDAMTTDRPYRKGMDPKEAIAELERNSGSQFDPDVVTVFIKLYQNDQIEKIINLINVKN